MKEGWSRANRERFDSILETVMGTLPRELLRLLDEAPLIVDDLPSAELLKSMGLDPAEDDLCGLHSGFSLMERSVSHSGELPEQIQIFRQGILDSAGGWDETVDEDGEAMGGEAAVEREIRITVLHEIGHHFGLSEEDLERLGYA
ncbi:MAG: metallopeptidase family protein [Phycisphaerales bacterium]|nr:metallopeptidase family protein [Phycisphaerales bacterium]